MVNLAQMMKKAQEMQTRMAEMQAGLAEATVDGVAGGGMVKVTLSGKGDMKAIHIDPSLFSGEEADVLEDLIMAAHAQAKAKAEEAMQKQMAEMTGGLGLPPGFKMPF